MPGFDFVTFKDKLNENENEAVSNEECEREFGDDKKHGRKPGDAESSASHAHPITGRMAHDVAQYVLDAVSIVITCVDVLREMYTAVSTIKFTP